MNSACFESERHYGEALREGIGFSIRHYLRRRVERHQLQPLVAVLARVAHVARYLFRDA